MSPKPGRVRFLPLVILLATMPAMMMPFLLALHLSAKLMGLIMGIPIGLSIVAIGWLMHGLAGERRDR